MMEARAIYLYRVHTSVCEMSNDRIHVTILFCATRSQQARTSCTHTLCTRALLSLFFLLLLHLSPLPLDQSIHKVFLGALSGEPAVFERVLENVRLHSLDFDRTDHWELATRGLFLPGLGLFRRLGLGLRAGLRIGLAVVRHLELRVALTNPRQQRSPLGAHLNCHGLIQIK